MNSMQHHYIILSHHAVRLETSPDSVCVQDVMTIYFAEDYVSMKYTYV